MSNIPKARDIIAQVLKCELSDFARKALQQAYCLMTREQPEFRAPPKFPKLTEEEGEAARSLRAMGTAMNDIAKHFNTNIARVSEAINRKAGHEL